jgi:trk system potassium uptake protein TrkH
LTAEYGFYLSDLAVAILRAVELAATLLVCLIKLALLLTADRPRRYLTNHWADYALIFTLIVQGFVYVALKETPEFQYLEARGLHVSLLTAYTVLVQLALVLILALESPFFHRTLVRLRLHPARSFLLSFVFIILLGALLLCLPKAVAPGRSLSFLDALFTATSAVCVTGLVVVDTGTHFSLLGQGIILTLIQLGGLGMFTFTAFLAVLLGRGLEKEEETAVGAWLNVGVTTKLARMVKLILAATFGMEGVGALLLYLDWAEEIPDPFARGFASGFHAVSAFCNAGFALFPDSLVRFAGAPVTNLAVMGLIVLGGLGFVVLVELGRLLVRRTSPGRCSLHTLLVLSMTLCLLGAGALLMVVTETGNTLDPAAGPAWLWMSAFQSVTLRTAGFNTVDCAALLPVTALWMMVFMAIGGSPGSTAGGMKTTTVTVLVAALRMRLRRQAVATLFHRPLTPGSVRRALTVAGLFTIAAVLLSAMLWGVEQAALLPVAFETVSALGTVGLSLGITGSLSGMGKLLIIAAMFIGRVGPLTVGIAVTGKTAAEALQQREERVLIG